MAGEQRWASYLAPALRPLYLHAAARVGTALGVAVDLVEKGDYSALARGEFDFAFVCGLPYVEIVDGLVSLLEPVVAPVLLGPRYGGEPIYFSDVVVPADGPARVFADLRGGRWAFNERGSHSGYLVTLERLARMGEDSGFFTEWVDAGFHEEAIRRVAAGTVDGAAIDSQVLAVILDREPGLAQRLRVIDSLGPSPIQPLVAGPHVPGEVREQVAAVLLGMGSDAADGAVLRAAHVERFVSVDDGGYDGIRRMLETVRMAGLWNAPRPPGLAAPVH